MEDQGRFSCQKCGKEYKWKPEFAGRKVKCKCGFVMSAPARAPVAAQKKREAHPDDGPSLDALYDLADEGKQAAAAAPAMIRCPHCRNEMEPGSIVCPSCGFNLKTGSKPSRQSASPAAAFAGAGAARAVVAPAGAGVAVGAGGAGGEGGAGGANLAAAGGVFAAYGAPRKRGGDLKVTRNDAVVDWYLPIGMLAGGMILGALKYSTFSAAIVPFPQALMYAGLVLVLGFVLMAGASIFIIQWGEVAFGDPAQAALKIAAAVTLPVFIANIISFKVHDFVFYGFGLVGFFLAFGMFFIFYHYMFEWDLSEKWIVVCVTTFITMMIVPLLVTVIVNGGHMPVAEENDDATVERMDEFSRTKDAHAWMAESKGRLIGDYAREDGEKFINDIYNLGAKRIWVVPEGPEAAEVYVELPSNSKRRKAVVDFCDQWMTAHKKGGVKDKGGKWLILIFFGVAHPPPV